MRKLLILSFLLLFAVIYSQKNVYIMFNAATDKHSNEMNKVNYFDILIDNSNHKTFQYGTDQVRSVKNFNNKVTNRNKLNLILKNDNPDRQINYIIVKKINNSKYILYNSDHIFRTIRD